MATYNRVVDLEVEAHVLGAGSPPSWYTTALSAGDIKTVVTDTVWDIGEADGWKRGVVGDYVVYVAADGDAPRTLTHWTKAAFEAIYELEE